MDAMQIKTFIDAMAASDLAEMVASKGGWTLRLARGPVPAALAAVAAPTTAAAPAPAPSAAASRWLDQPAPLGGLVFLQPAPGEPPFVRPGQAVKVGQTLAVIEAMKTFNDVVAESDGVVEGFLVDSGDEVAADQPIVRLRCAG